MLDYKFAVTNGTRYMKLLALIDFSILLNSISSLVATHLGWAIKPNNTPGAVTLANRKVVCSSGIANSLVMSGI